MSERFQVDVNDQSVSVQLNFSPRTRLYGGILFIAIEALAICALVFTPGRYGHPNMWHSLSQYPVNSGDFIVALFILAGFSILFGLVLWRQVVSAYPSDETFYCDKATLTISKVRWLDIRNKHWDTRSYPLADVAKMRYQAIVSARGSISGLSFVAGGRTERVLANLKRHQADKILKALKAFGVDVPDDE